MKIKMNETTHMFLLLIVLKTLCSTEAETSDPDVSESNTLDSNPLKYRQPSLFYKGKFFSFYPLEDEVHVYENNMIPYLTKIKNVLFPKPKGYIIDIYSPIKDKLIVVETDDGQKWYYERLKLRRTENFFITTSTIIPSETTASENTSGNVTVLFE